MSDTQDEFRLVGLAREGDRQAFGELVRRHASNVRRLAAGILGDASEAEDAAQEVFVKAWRGLKGFKSESSFSTWVHRITVNHCRDVLRRRRRGGWLTLDGLIEVVAGRRAMDEGKPDETAGETDAKDELRQVLGGLPEDYRTVLLLRELNGLSYEEIARTMRVTVDSVKARLKRARRAALAAARHLEAGDDV